jgi:hypothetical protein
MRVDRSWTPAERDRAARRLRALTWGVAIVSAGATAGLSAVAAHAFKGHSAKPAAAAPRPAAAVARVSVPGPQQVPAIAGQPAALQPPPDPPAAAPSVAQSAPPPPPVSGGS